MKKSLMVGFVAFACSAVFSLTGRQVIEKYFEINPAPDFSNTEFRVDSYKGSVLDDSITLDQYGRDKNNLTETVFEVVKNPNLKGTRFLQSQKPGEDARFIYMPSLRQIRRINVQDSTKSFVGTEFTYNDTAKRVLEDDDHELIKENETVKIDNTTYTCHVVKSVPVSKKNIEYDYRIQYYDIVSYMPVKTEYFDKNDKLTKVMEIKKLGIIKGATGKDHYTRLVTEMTNKKTGRRSVLTIIKQELDKPLKPGYFQQSWLNTGKAN